MGSSCGLGAASVGKGELEPQVISGSATVCLSSPSHWRASLSLLLPHCHLVTLHQGTQGFTSQAPREPGLCGSCLCSGWGWSALFVHTAGCQPLGASRGVPAAGLLPDRPSRSPVLLVFRFSRNCLARSLFSFTHSLHKVRIHGYIPKSRGNYWCLSC